MKIRRTTHPDGLAAPPSSTAPSRRDFRLYRVRLVVFQHWVMVGGSSPEADRLGSVFWKRRPNMEYFAGLDVSMEETHVCVITRNGTVIHEAKVPSTPAGIARHWPEFRAVNGSCSKQAE